MQAGSRDDSGPQFTQLATMSQQELQQQQSQGIHHNDGQFNMHDQNNCKMEEDFFPKQYEVATDPSKIPLSHEFIQTQTSDFSQNVPQTSDPLEGIKVEE